MNKLFLIALCFLAVSKIASSYPLISVEDITDVNVEHLEDEDDTFTLYDAENQEEVEVRFENGYFVNEEGERVFSEEDYETYDEDDEEGDESYESYDEGKYPDDDLYHDWVVPSTEDEEGYNYYVYDDGVISKVGEDGDVSYFGNVNNYDYSHGDSDATDDSG